MSTLEHSVRRIAAVGAVALFVPVAPAAAATVVRVIDGDTVKVRDDGKLRTVDLAGVNAPERGACAGTEARRGLARLLPAGARVRLQRDADAPARARYVFRGGRLVNAAVLRRGLARAEDTGELSKREPLEAAAQEAQQQRKGIWKSCEASPLAVAVAVSAAAAPAGRRRSSALAPTSPAGCSSRSPARASSTRPRPGCTSAGTATAVLDISWSNDASGGSGSQPHRGLVGGRERRVHGDDGDRARSPVQRRRGDVPDLLRTGTARVDRRRRPDPGRLERPVRGPPGRLIAGAGRCSGRAARRRRRRPSSASSTATRCRCARAQRCARCTWPASMRRSAGRAGASRPAARSPGCCRAARASGSSAMPRRPPPRATSTAAAGSSTRRCCATASPSRATPAGSASARHCWPRRARPSSSGEGSGRRARRPRRRHRTLRPPGRRRSRARGPSSPSGCSS